MLRKQVTQRENKRRVVLTKSPEKCFLWRSFYLILCIGLSIHCHRGLLVPPVPVSLFKVTTPPFWWQIIWRLLTFCVESGFQVRHTIKRTLMTSSAMTVYALVATGSFTVWSIMRCSHDRLQFICRLTELEVYAFWRRAAVFHCRSGRE